jgi:nucleotide-binding universal stress UspA family protein
MGNTPIIIGVDENFSHLTQYALRMSGDLFDVQVTFLLLTVIPTPYDTTPTWLKARGIGQIQPPGATHEQRAQADATLHKAQALLKRTHSHALRETVLLQRFGDPAIELVKAAQENQATSIVLGNRGEHSPLRYLRRFFSGSISQAIYSLSSCPLVLLTPPLQAHGLSELSFWYQDAITRYLSEQLDTLTVLTPEDVIQRFVPPGSISTSTRGTMLAAAHALEALSLRGQLTCHQSMQDRKYVND